MLKKLLDFIKKPTSLNIFINTFGNYLNVIFTAFFAILLTRVFNAVDYGVLSVLLAVAYVLTNILDLGTTASIYSYLPALVTQKNSKNIGSFLKTIFSFQTAASFLLIIILLVVFPAVDKLFLKTEASSIQFYVTAFSIIFLVWQNYATNAMNAAKEFFKVNLWSNLSNIVKTVFLVALIIFHRINIESVIFSFGILGPAAFLILVAIDQKKIFWAAVQAPFEKKELRAKYTFTFFIASQFLNLSQRVDIFMLSFFMPRSQAIGYYGLAQKIILNVITAIVSVTQVLSPNFSQTKKKADILKQMKHGLLYMLVPAGIFIALFLTPTWIFTLAFTKRFDSAIPITRSLSLPFILYVFLNLPLIFILYTVKKPVHILIAYFLIFAIIASGCYLLIPKYKVFAPSMAITAAFAVGLIYLTLAALSEYRNYKEV